MTRFNLRPDEADELAMQQAALYLAGALDAAQRRTFEDAIDRGQRSELDALRALERGVLALGLAAGAIDPPPALRERVLTDVAGSNRGGGAQVWRDWGSDVSPEGLFTLHVDQGAWEDTGVPGVEVRKLFVDRAANRMTAMFRMAPGTSYPEHHHDGHEECYVLHGDLHVGDALIMRSGDYQRAEPGSPHARQWTEGGCVLLVSTSLSDEIEE